MDGLKFEYQLTEDDVRKAAQPEPTCLFGVLGKQKVSKLRFVEPPQKMDGVSKSVVHVST